MCAYTISIPALGVRVRVQFASRGARDLLVPFISGQLSGARLPAVEWDELNDGPPDVAVDATDLGDDLLVSYDGRFKVSAYRVDKPGLHWDFWKVVTGCVVPQLIARGLVPVHAAAIAWTSEPGSGVDLLAGGSGAGKSSVAYAALELGGRIVGSELCFVDGGAVVAANQSLTIDPAAMDAFALIRPVSSREEAGRLVTPTHGPKAPLAIRRIIFPRVSNSRLVVRPISTRRARMLLFHNVLGELSIVQLVNHETVPLGHPPSVDELAIISRLTANVAEHAPVIVEGTPMEVARYLRDCADGAEEASD